MNILVQPEERVQRIRRLTGVSRALTYAASLDELFQMTVASAVDLFAAEKSLLMIADENGRLALRSSHGVDASLAERFREPFTEALVQRLAEFLEAPTEKFLGVPLVVNGTIRGILVVIRPTVSTVAEEDEWLLSALADQAAVAMEKTRLDEIGEFREQLMGIVGHDLRNPLGGILMAAHTLLLLEGLGEPATELARKIARSASTASLLINQLLDLTRSRLGGGIAIATSRLDMMQVVRQVVDENELTYPKQRLRLHLTGDVTGVWDRDRLYQLVANLIGNAFQHGAPEAPIDVRIDGGDTEVLLEVANQGDAIPAAMLPFVFDAFRKGRVSLPTRTQGLGLGLFIAQQIAIAHGGLITVTSSEGEGTTFRVRLPRSGAEPPVIPTDG